MTPLAQQPKVVDSFDLEFGGGLEVLLNAALEGLQIGDELALVTASRAVALEAPGWARINGHVAPSSPERNRKQWRLVIVKGAERFLAQADDGLPSDPPENPGSIAGWRSEPPPPTADSTRGFAPIGSIPERLSMAEKWQFNGRDQLWIDEIGELVERSHRQAWSASTDIPWEAAATLHPDIERAIAQAMTYIAQNEYAAMYAPAAHLSRVNPEFAEVLLWLSAHVHDEARHIEVFTKRALFAGGGAWALASTELSLRTLLDEHEFGNASLLLNVLGEGTFLDLLKFINRHAPDAATEAATRLAHRDERRHVQFGIALVRRTLEADPAAADRFIASVERRAAKLTSIDEIHPIVAESLTVIAAGEIKPAALGRGAAAVGDLWRTMHKSRVRRLRACGFDDATADYVSMLHTPNLM